jgi:hypothetical protein
MISSTSTPGSTLLDKVLPEFEFSERHHEPVAAPPERVREALLALTPRDVRVTRALLSIRLVPRRLTGRGAPSLGEDRAMLEFLDEYGFVRLAESEREIVYGIADQFWRPRTDPVRLEDRDAFLRFASPGFAKAAFNFSFQPSGGGTELVTKTRIHALDEEARRKFGRYWLLIRGGSGLIRRDILAAVRRRAEGVRPDPRSGAGGR